MEVFSLNFDEDYCKSATGRNAFYYCPEISLCQIIATYFEKKQQMGVYYSVISCQILLGPSEGAG